MDAVHDCGRNALRNALLVQSKTDALRNTLGCEPLPQKWRSTFGLPVVVDSQCLSPMLCILLSLLGTLFSKPWAIESTSLA